jgi:hypothetical protein
MKALTMFATSPAVRDARAGIEEWCRAYAMAVGKLVALARRKTLIIRCKFRPPSLDTKAVFAGRSGLLRSRVQAREEQERAIQEQRQRRLGADME